MLAKLFPGWVGETIVLVLLGFAATDFVITITLSAPDATAHILENPVVQQQKILAHPELIQNWQLQLNSNYLNPLAMIAAAALVFPKLALGLSGFETGVSVMPLVRGAKDDDTERIRLAANDDQQCQPRIDPQTAFNQDLGRRICRRSSLFASSHC